VGTVLQFQLHSALCKAAGQFDLEQSYTKPLFKCDIYRSKEAGRLLKQVSISRSVTVLITRLRYISLKGKKSIYARFNFLHLSFIYERQISTLQL
jgi:hypothetical protein